jgi:hypothetical protein
MRIEALPNPEEGRGMFSSYQEHEDRSIIQAWRGVRAVFQLLGTWG